MDAFPCDGGVIVGRSSGVFVRDRSGAVLHEYQSPRDITSAAFDGSLAVADMAVLTKLDTNLEVLGAADLAESCASSVIVSGDRFICGPDNDWERVFYTYDLKKMELVATSSPYTYNGIPMGRVPGKDDFVTITRGMSPTDFHLYTVNSASKVVYINESPYHADFAISEIYAFDGTPAEHVITEEGLLIRIYGTACSLGGYPSTCIEKDGVLGTLHAGERFIALTDDGAGKLFGLVTSAGNYYGAGAGRDCARLRPQPA